MRERISLDQLWGECHAAWGELVDHESKHGLWRTGTQEYEIYYTNTGLRFVWNAEDGWTSPGEVGPW